MILCIFAAYAKNAEYVENVHHFVWNGGILPHVDYVFVVNDGGLPLDLPKEGDMPNVRVLHRPNKGYDFGAWSHALSVLGGTLELRKKYDTFLFMNSSVRGPCGTPQPDWTAQLTALLQGNVALAGLSINVLPIDKFPGARTLVKAYGLMDWQVLPHVQSMLFCVKADALRLLVESGIFDPVPEKTDFRSLIIGRELRMSVVLLAAGYNISCLAKRYRGLDYVHGGVRTDPNPTSTNGDPFFPGSYWGDTIDPREVIFYKTERLGVLPVQLLDTVKQ